MTTPIQVWLQAADTLFGAADASDDAVDDLVHEGLEIDTTAPGEVDPVQLERVLAVLRARAAAMATELADLSRQRSAAGRAGEAASSYLSATAFVPNM